MSFCLLRTCTRSSEQTKGNPKYHAGPHQSSSPRVDFIQKQNFIDGIYIFIGMLGHRLPMPVAFWNVSDFEFSDVYFIISFYAFPMWLRRCFVWRKHYDHVHLLQVCTQFRCNRRFYIHTFKIPPSVVPKLEKSVDASWKRFDTMI